jgi:aspartate aminotransferase
MLLAKRAQNISPSPTLAIDAKAKKMKAEGENVISFGVGEPDFDTPDHIKEAAKVAIEQGFTKYTAVAGIDPLKKAIINKFKKDNDLEFQMNEIVVAAGAKHSLFNAFQVLCDEGDEVIIPAPYWVSYIEQVKLAGGVAKIIYTQEENNFKVTPQQLEQVITDKTKIFLLNSPSNPTGAVYSKEELQVLANYLEDKNIWIISDEIYEKLLYDGLTHTSIASLSSKLKEKTVIINGVSKAYSMTGWRIGYSASNPVVAKAMADLQSHSTSNPTSIAQKASINALEGSQDCLAEMLTEFEKRRNYMLERVRAINGVTCNKPGGAFYLYPNISAYLGKVYEGKPIASANDLCDILLAVAKIAVVPGNAFGNNDNIRLSYATSMENIVEGMDRMEQVLNQIK